MVKTKWLILPLLIALVILPRVSIDFYLPSLSYIGNALHSNDASLQMTLTIFMLGYALSMLITGPLSDALGKKRVLIYGLILYILATLACATATSILFLIIARFFQALGGCCGTVIARVMVKDAYIKEDQIKILSQLSAAMAICPLLIPILGGIAQIYLGWRAIFYVLGLFSLLLLILAKKQIIEPPEANFPSVSLKILLKHYKLLITNRLFMGYSFTIGLAWCNYFAFTLKSPFLLQKILGFNAISFGGLLAIVVLGYFIGTQIAKRFANEIGWNKLILIATIVCFLGALLLIIFNMVLPLNWIILIFPMMINMVGVGIIIPCTQAAVMQPFSNMAGTASGLFFFIQMIFGTICGFILQHFNREVLTSMLITISACSLMLIVVFYTLIWSLKHNEKENDLRLFLKPIGSSQS